MIMRRLSLHNDMSQFLIINFILDRKIDGQIDHRKLKRKREREILIGSVSLENPITSFSPQSNAIESGASGLVLTKVPTGICRSMEDDTGQEKLNIFVLTWCVLSC